MIKILQTVHREEVENEPSLLAETIILKKYFLGIRLIYKSSVTTYNITEFNEERHNSLNNIGFGS